MQRPIFFVILFCLAGLPCVAESTIVSTATAFITQYQYSQATHYLDSILKLQPNNVDALMMKGNVLLNYTWQKGARNYFNLEKAESVLDTADINQSLFIPVVPEDTSKLIENYWKHCLQLDSTRNDIRKGICNLYSLSLRIEDLKWQLWQMRSLITENEENAYVYAEYARNVKIRGQFDEAMSIYQLIADMFPDVAGIRADMAGEYFYNGRPKDALRYLDSALSKKDIDETTYINAATIYSTLGYYDNAYKTFVRYSQRDSLLVGDFYKGLMMFAESDTNFYQQFYSFIQKASEQSYYDEIQLAKKLLPFGRVEFTLDDYKSLNANGKIPYYYKVLIHQRAMRQFKDKCEPYIYYGIQQCANRNYATAIQFLEQWTECSFSAESELGAMACSYSYYMTGDKKRAVWPLTRLLSSEDAFRVQAAQYFTAKIAFDGGEKEQAKKLFTEIVKSKQPTKYAWLAKTYLRKLN